MAATTRDRNTFKQYIQRQIALQLNPATDIPLGVMVMVIAGVGLAVNAADTANGIVMGISAHSASYAAGDRDLVVERGAFWMANDGTITRADVGGACTVLDNQTVSKAATTTNDVVPGYIEDVSADLGVLVSMLGGKVSAT
jgi:hypothetical protein